MCPLTCRIVEQAIKAYEQYGIIMGKYVDDCKKSDPQCVRCTRNEYAVMPIKDNSGSAGSK